MGLLREMCQFLKANCTPTFFAPFQETVSTCEAARWNTDRRGVEGGKGWGKGKGEGKGELALVGTNQARGV